MKKWVYTLLFIILVVIALYYYFFIRTNDKQTVIECEASDDCALSRINCEQCVCLEAVPTNWTINCSEEEKNWSSNICEECVTRIAKCIKNKCETFILD